MLLQECSTIEETTDTWGLPSLAAQLLKQWLADPTKGGWKLEKLPDEDLHNITNDDLKDARIIAAKTRKTMLRNLRPQQGDLLE